MLHKFLWVLAFVPFCLKAQITITSETSFSKSVVGAEFGSLESTNSPDNGGLLTLFVVNNGTLPDSITEVKASKNGSYASPYLMWWPLQIEPGKMAAVQVKDIAAPLAENDTVLIEVFTSKGHSATQTFINKTPSIKIANLLPSQDMSDLYIYLRNDGNSPATVNEIKLNDNTYFSGSAVLQPISGGFTVAAGDILILKLLFNNPQRELSLLNLRVKSTTGGNNVQWTSTFQRLLKAEFPLGTWNSSLFDNDKEEGRKLLRQYALTSVFGPGNYGLMENAHDEYHFRTVREANFDSAGTFGATAGAQETAQRAEEPFIHYWSIDDEPDLNGKDVWQGIAKNYAYWMNDTNTPSYVNLAVMKKYQRWSFFTDVVSMDHYTDDGAPNVIPLSWITREGSPREAIEYTDYLKYNSEPKRMLTWSQLAAGTWNPQQPEDYIVNFQFWSHVSCGAKGIHFFVAQTNTKQNFPQQWEEGLRCTQQLNTCKNLFLYGESWKKVSVKSGNVVARANVGPDAITITVLNNSIDYTLVNIFDQDWSSSIVPVTYELEFTVPDWIPLEQFYEATTQGKQSANSIITQVSGRTYRIAGVINNNSQVFVIGKNDTQAPGAVTGLNVPDKVSPNQFTLSWKEPYDNFGVKGYYIKADNDIIDSVRFPIWEAKGKVNACAIGYWSVIPYDDAGNTGQPQVITIDWSGIGSGTPVIYANPADVTVNAGSFATFTIQDSAAAGVAYQWQVDTGSGTWLNLSESSDYQGVHTAQLKVYSTQYNTGHAYRCVVTAGCAGAQASSTAATLTVNGSVGVNDVTVQVQLYPNPVNNVLYLVHDGLTHGAQVCITDVLGRTVHRQAVEPGKNTVPLAGAVPGVYTVTISDAAHSYFYTQKIIKQ